MFSWLSESVISVFCSAARKLTGWKRRQFQAEVAIEYCGGSPRKAESIFGWSRTAVANGLQEMQSGERRPENFQARGRRRTEDLHPELKAAIIRLADPQSQADPKFQTTLAFTRLTGQAVRQGLLREFPDDPRVPSERSARRMLTRLGYPQRKVRKTIPLKKIPQTNAIFEHLKNVHTSVLNEPETLRISLDTKAKVMIGPFSRGGYARGRQPVRAVDHDYRPLAVLVPAGILEVQANQFHIVFGTSRDTSDFVADAVDWWWRSRKAAYPHVRRLLIDLDNGPQVSSSRTQFMYRLVDFCDRNQISLELAYYPPYHSQYNAIERCWGVLENHWNGTVLSSIPTALEWAKSMTWRGVSPIVHYWDRVYQSGVRIARAAYRPIAARLLRAADIGKWSVRIEPAKSP